MKVLHKFDNLPLAVKASIVYLIGSVISKALAYITTPIYTRMLSSEEYGQTSVFYTWQQILGILAMFNLSAGVFNNGMVDFPNKRNEYSYSMLTLSWLITSVFVIMLMILYPYIKEWLELPFNLVVLICVTFYFMPAYKFWIAKQRYEYKYKLPLFYAVLISIGSPVFAIFCIWAFPDNRLYGRIWGAEGFLIVVYLFFIFHIASKTHYKIDTSYWKSAFLFNLPLLPHYLSILILGGSDRIMISLLEGNQQTAYYTVAYSVAVAIVVIWSAINSSLVPYTYEKCKNNDYDSIARVTSPILFIFALICFFVCLLSPEIVKIMATNEYMEAIYVIPPVIGGVFFQVQYYIYANIVYYHKFPKYVMLGSLVAATLNIILNYIFIPLLGYISAGYTTLLCYMIQAAIDYYAMKRVVGKSVYNMKKILMLSIIVIVFSITSGLLYQLYVIRFITIMIILLLMVFKKETIYQTIFLNK